MPNIFQLLPSLEGEEMSYAQSLINDMTDASSAICYGLQRTQKGSNNNIDFGSCGFCRFCRIASIYA